MTNEVLESDIELARSLLRQGQSPEEIGNALVRRGVRLERARELASDLQQGKKVEADAPFGRSWSRSAGAEGRIGSQSQAEAFAIRGAADERTDYPRERSRPETLPRASSRGQRWLRAGLAIMGVAAIAVVILRAHKGSQQLQKQPTGVAGGYSAGPVPSQGTTPRLSRAIFHLDNKGFRVGDRTLRSNNALGELAALFGTPSRTNQVEGLRRTVYAFDEAGVLVYTDKKAQTESVLLDFGALGGSIGTTQPCRGALLLDRNEITANTTAGELAGIKRLGLPPGVARAGVLGASYCGFDLVFSYFSSPRQLSLLEVDFK